MNFRIGHARGLLLACGLFFLGACAEAPPESPVAAPTEPAAAEEATAEPAAAEEATAEPTAAEEATAEPTAAEEATAEPAAAEEATAEPAAAEEASDTQGGLLVHVTTDDTWSANMALSMATTARNQGVDPVIVFLSVRGTYLADSERLPAREGNSELNIHERFQAFVEAGGEVIACPNCSREAGLAQDDYIEGVTVGEPGGILPLVTDPAITVISFTGQEER